MGLELNTNSFLTNFNGTCDNSILTNGEFFDKPFMGFDPDFINDNGCNCSRCRRQRRNQSCYTSLYPCPPTPVTILSPLQGEIITIPRPVITGRAFPNVVVNVCVDHMTCRLAMTDSQGYWRVTSPVVFSGIGEHIISVSEVNKVQTNINYKESTIQVNIP